MRALTILLVAAVAIIAVLAYGREETWRLVLGPADLGPVEFDTLVRSARPNDALACPRGLCLKAKPDVVPPVYAVSADVLHETLHGAVSLEPLIDRVAESEETRTSRYVQRSPLLRFPDTISVRVIPRGPGRATLALYSRSKIGYSDLGVNEARLKRWIRLLDALPKAE